MAVGVLVILGGISVGGFTLGMLVSGAGQRHDETVPAGD
mgnify:CR=1 FL=1